METAPSAAGPTPELPRLDPGLQLLGTDARCARAVHALTVDHVLLAGGDACWIDTGRHARAAPLVDLAPSPRILDRVQVARGFTPFQHLALCETLPDLVTPDTELVVVPDLDGYYRNEDLLADEGDEMFLRAIAILAGVAREHGIPVLVTRQRPDGFAAPIERAAAGTLHCEATSFGPRFRTDGEETLVYPDGRYVQTTLAFWERVLDAREPLYAAGEVTARGTN